MTIDLSRIRATALAATPEFGRFFLAVPPEVERHIETMSPATTLALVDALIEWRDAVVAADEAYGRSADLEDYTAVLDRRNEAETALLALIGGKPEQETNNDAG